jgi:hypothetical protein
MPINLDGNSSIIESSETLARSSGKLVAGKDAQIVERYDRCCGAQPAQEIASWPFSK